MDKTTEFIMTDHTRIVAENTRLQQELALVTAERDQLKKDVNRLNSELVNAKYEYRAAKAAGHKLGNDMLATIQTINIRRR